MIIGGTSVHGFTHVWSCGSCDVSDLCASHVSRRQCRGHDASWMHPLRDVPRRRPDRKELGILIAAKPYLSPSPLEQLAACAKKKVHSVCSLSDLHYHLLPYPIEDRSPKEEKGRCASSAEDTMQPWKVQLHAVGSRDRAPIRQPIFVSRLAP